MKELGYIEILWGVAINGGGTLNFNKGKCGRSSPFKFLLTLQEKLITCH